MKNTSQTWRSLWRTSIWSNTDRVELSFIFFTYTLSLFHSYVELTRKISEVFVRILFPFLYLALWCPKNIQYDWGFVHKGRFMCKVLDILLWLNCELRQPQDHVHLFSSRALFGLFLSLSFFFQIIKFLCFVLKLIDFGKTLLFVGPFEEGIIFELSALNLGFSTAKLLRIEIIFFRHSIRYSRLNFGNSVIRFQCWQRSSCFLISEHNSLLETNQTKRTRFFLFFHQFQRRSALLIQ